MFPNNSLSRNLNFYATNYERDLGMKDLYNQILPVLSLGRRGMSQERKLISFLGHTKGTCEVLAERWGGWREAADALLGHAPPGSCLLLLHPRPASIGHGALGISTFS